MEEIPRMTDDKDAVALINVKGDMEFTDEHQMKKLLPFLTRLAGPGIVMALWNKRKP
jgi:hypothetical protein